MNQNMPYGDLEKAKLTALMNAGQYEQAIQFATNKIQLGEDINYYQQAIVNMRMLQDQQRRNADKRKLTYALIAGIGVLTVLIVIGAIYFLLGRNKSEAAPTVITRVDTVKTVVEKPARQSAYSSSPDTGSGRIHVEGYDGGVIDIDTPTGYNAKVHKAICRWISIHLGGGYKGDVTDLWTMAEWYVNTPKMSNVHRTIHQVSEDGYTVTWESVYEGKGMVLDKSATFDKSTGKILY